MPLVNALAYSHKSNQCYMANQLGQIRIPLHKSDTIQIEYDPYASYATVYYEDIVDSDTFYLENLVRDRHLPVISLNKLMVSTTFPDKCRCCTLRVLSDQVQMERAISKILTICEENKEPLIGATAYSYKLDSCFQADFYAEIELPLILNDTFQFEFVGLQYLIQTVNEIKLLDTVYLEGGKTIPPLIIINYPGRELNYTKQQCKCCHK
jgi:hypothetical protein